MRLISVEIILLGGKIIYLIHFFKRVNLWWSCWNRDSIIWAGILHVKNVSSLQTKA